MAPPETRMTDPKTLDWTPETGDLAHSGPLPGHRRGQPDPGSSGARLLTWLILVPAFLMVVGLQQFSVFSANQTAIQEAQEIRPAGKADTFGLMSRFAVKIDRASRELSGGDGPDMNTTTLMTSVRDSATSPADRVRVAIVAGEMLGAEEAEESLAEAEEDLENLGELLEEHYRTGLTEDIALLRRLYAGESLSPEERQCLIDHHGWHGRVALSFGMDNDDPERKELLSGGLALVLGLAAFGLVVVLALLGGLAAFIVLMVKLGSDRLRMRFVAPSPGGSVYLETFAIFVCLFLGMQLVGALVGQTLPSWAQYALQWLVLPAIFWPLLRGVSLTRWRRDLGLVAPEGLFREIGAGLFVYLASIPVYLAAALMGLALVFLRNIFFQIVSPSAPPAVEPPMSNPVIDLIDGTDTASLVVLASLVTLWAPIVEELIMRGALYRHLRSRARFIVAALTSALLFGLLHQYDVFLMLPVMALGGMFALIREWRGSILGGVLAHAVHNTAIFGLIAWIVSTA